MFGLDISVVVFVGWDLDFFSQEEQKNSINNSGRK